MRPLGQSLIWGLANALFYGLGSLTSYPNAVAPQPSDRWVWAAVAFIVVLPVSTFAAWYVIRPRTSVPLRAWRLGGVASCIAAGVVYVPVLYWITATSYVWYIRDYGTADNTMITFLGGVLALTIEVTTIFLVMLGLSEAVRWVRRRVGSGRGSRAAIPQ